MLHLQSPTFNLQLTADSIGKESTADARGTFTSGGRLSMEGYDAEIFVSKDFEVDTFTFGDLSQRLYCLKAAVTDYDLTGLIVWPASRVLSWFLLQNRELIEGKHLLEVGAGCGLTGFIAQQCGAASVTLTDGNSEVLQIINKSCSLNSERSDLEFSN